jgi:hypothetical protein
MPTQSTQLEMEACANARLSSSQQRMRQNVRLATQAVMAVILLQPLVAGVIQTQSFLRGRDQSVYANHSSSQPRMRPLVSNATPTAMDVVARLHHVALVTPMPSFPAGKGQSANANRDSTQPLMRQTACRVMRRVTAV